MVKKNKINKLKISVEDENEICVENIKSILEINECITMYNKYQENVLQNIFNFIRT